MNESTKEDLIAEVRNFDKLVSKIRDAICGLETDGSYSEKKIVEFEPLLAEAKDLAKDLMFVAAELLEVHIVVGVRDVMFDLEEQFEEIKHGCPLDA